MLNHPTQNEQEGQPESTEELPDKTNATSINARRQPKSKPKKSISTRKSPVFKDQSAGNEHEDKTEIEGQEQKKNENTRNSKRKAKSKAKGPVKKKGGHSSK